MRSQRSSSAPPRIAWWETLGGWLHVWTPPKGIDPPPVPWRWIAGILALAAIALVIAIPRIDESKREGEARRARAEAAAAAVERARLRADQRLHRVTVAAGTPLVAALEEAINRDARARVAAKTISGPVLGTSCEAAGVSTRQFPDSRVYKCFVKTATGLPGQDEDVLGTGYPFVATVYARTRQVAWCKQNPHADEKGHRGQMHVKLSPVCAGKLTAVL